MWKPKPKRKQDKTEQSPGADTATPPPEPRRYYDIEEYRRAGNRKLWAAIGLLSMTTLMSFILALATILKPTPVIAFDAKGRPMLFEETYRPNIETSKIRVEFFTQTFLTKYIGIDSTRLEEDFAEALNLCEPLVAERIIKEGSQAKRRAQYQDGNVRSRFADLEFRINDFDPADMESQIFLYVWGEHLYEPITGRVDEDVTRHVFAKFILTREAATRQNPYGLLVYYIEYYVFETADALQAELLNLMAS